MSAEYLIQLPDGSLDGPYTEEDLLDMVDADELGAGTICEDLATRRRCRVRDLFKVIPPAEDSPDSLQPPGRKPSAEEDVAGEEEKNDAADRPAPAARSSAPAPARWVPAPLPQHHQGPVPPAPLPPRTVYTGHPSFWNYWRSLGLSLGLMAGGWYAGRWDHGVWWLAAGWVSGSLWLALTLLRRSAVEYRVTTRRVEIQQGLISKSSREIRIPDIRAINVRKSGFTGLLGVGDLSFSSSTGGEEDVVFHQTPGAHRLKNRVRQLQDRGT